MAEIKTLKEQVEEINTELRAFGREAIQEIKLKEDDQKTGEVRYGFKAQYVFDAVNSVLSPENWRYEVVCKEIFDNQVVAEVRLYIRVNDSDWICKGSQMGQMQITEGNIGDAYKGAITDALQKCLSLLSIGSDAYRGVLSEVYFSESQHGAKAPERKPQQSTNNGNRSGNNCELPKIDGIKYQHQDGIVIAVGNSYDKKEVLKSAGFKWDKADKNWYKDVQVH